MPTLLARVCCAAVLIAVGAVTLAAEPEQKPAVDAEARQVLDNWAEFSKGLDGFRVTIESQLSLPLPFGYKHETELRLDAKRPNQLAFSCKSATEDWPDQIRVRCDGTNFTAATLYEGPPPTGKYALDKAPENWAALARTPVASLLVAATLVPVSNAMLVDDPTDLLLSSSTSVTYAGRETLDGVECHVIHSSGDSSNRNAKNDFEWQLWIETGDRPLVRQSKATLSGLSVSFAESARISLKGAKTSIVAVFKDWEVNLTFAEETFVTSRPEGTTVVGSLMEAINGKPAVKKLAAPAAKSESEKVSAKQEAPTPL